MSEGEIYELLEKLVDRCNECKFATCENCEINWKQVQAIQGLLDLYNNEKEKNMVTIPTSSYTLQDKIHKLKEELNKEKEKNKGLEIELEIRKYCKVDELTNDLIYYKNLAREYQGNCISKDKIREKMKEEMNKGCITATERHLQNYAYDRLKELLEEE